MNGHRELNGMHLGAAATFVPEYSQFPANNMGSNQAQWLNNHPTQFMPQFPQQHQHQQHPFNPGFMNQMQQFSSAMGLNSLFQQQIFQDALAMSQPVEAADEPLLVQALLSARKMRESYKDALNGLHGKNGHSASLWKDYYLDHKDHIDTWINMCLQKEKSQPVERDLGHVGAKPSYARQQVQPIKREFSPTRLPVSAPPANRKRKHASPSGSTSVYTAITGRNTVNSLTVPEPVFNDRLPPPNAEIKIPDPPSRSPSPPTKVIPQGRGNKYTEEDRQFFLKFISWRLKQDPSLTRNDLCNMLAEKAPHHTAQSWASHWSNRHDVPDKILAAARGESVLSDDDDDDDEPELTRPTKRRPRYKEISTDEDEDNDEEEEEDAKSEGEDDDAEDDGKAINHYLESEMGQKGDPFTDADLYMVAKHAAKFSRWLDMPSKDRWEPFTEKFTQRSTKSWAEYYRRNEDNILRLRKKMRQEVPKGGFYDGSVRPNHPHRQSKSGSEELDGQRRQIGINP